MLRFYFCREWLRLIRFKLMAAVLNVLFWKVRCKFRLLMDYLYWSKDLVSIILFMPEDQFIGELRCVLIFRTSLCSTVYENGLPSPGFPVKRLHWSMAGLIIFGFAAPAAVVGVPYSIAMNGLFFGSLACVVVTLASIGGSLMLVEVALAHPECQTLGEIGSACMVSCVLRCIPLILVGKHRGWQCVRRCYYGNLC